MLNRNALLVGLITAALSQAAVVHASTSDVASASQGSVHEGSSNAHTRAAISSQSALYIDVRSWVEYQVDGITSHTHIHYPDIANEIAQHAASKDQLVYVYCAVGGRAEHARQALIADGYTNVVNLGGIEQVKQQIELQSQE